MLGFGALGQFALGESTTAAPISATVSQTIAPVTISATLANIISVSVVQTIQPVTLSASAANVISASVNITIDPVTALISAQIRDGTTILMPRGTAFTRKRWRELLEADELAAKAAREIKIAARKKRREEAALVQAEARKAVLAARVAQEQDWAEQERIRQLTGALSSFHASQNIRGAMDYAARMAEAAQSHRRMLDDEDEAVSLLMLHG